MQLSVVIATYNDPLGLYMTVFSVIQQLRAIPTLDWEVVIAADGGTEYKWEKIPRVRCLRLAGGNRTGSPQGTRDAGIRAAKYPTVLCIESHVVVFNISEWLAAHWFECGNPALSFPRRVAEGPEMFDVYGSTTDWEGNLWYGHHVYTASDRPHRIVQFGHSAFMVNRNWYVDSGGYTNLQKGWGGEEPFLCLKAWMLGESCWMIPQAGHAHYLTPNAHGDSMMSVDFKRNFQIVRFVMNGEPGNLFLNPALLAERQKICAGPFHGHLSELRDYFKREGIET
jgi:glycosyltransferase involved in cell wall biosynthesis